MHDQLSWLEHIPYKDGVTGPNPVLCTSIPGSAPMAGRSASGPGVNTKYFSLALQASCLTIGDGTRVDQWDGASIQQWNLAHYKYK